MYAGSSQKHIKCRGTLDVDMSGILRRLIACVDTMSKNGTGPKVLFADEYVNHVTFSQFSNFMLQKMTENSENAPKQVLENLLVVADYIQLWIQILIPKISLLRYNVGMYENYRH